LSVRCQTILKRTPGASSIRQDLHPSALAILIGLGPLLLELPIADAFTRFASQPAPWQIQLRFDVTSGHGRPD